VKFLYDQSVAAQDRVEQILYELKKEEAEREAHHDEPDTPSVPNAADAPSAPSAPVKDRD
jgi:hypothetical protein